MSEPSGPIENGTTYMVRPRIEPSNRPSRVARISAGSAQLLVGPASSARSEQMKVRSSTRSEEHTSELQSLMRISYAVFCLKKKKKPNTHRMYTPKTHNT